MANQIDWSALENPLKQAGGIILGSVIGGPAGAALGPMIIQTLATALGVDPTPEAVSAAIPGNPGIVQQVEATHGKALKSSEQAYLDDIGDARAKELEYAKMGSPVAWAPVILSVIIVSGFLALIGAFFFRALPDSQVVLILIGTLTVNTTQVVNYWLGSSSGSADKSNIMGALLKLKTVGGK